MKLRAQTSPPLTHAAAAPVARGVPLAELPPALRERIERSVRREAPGIYGGHALSASGVEVSQVLRIELAGERGGGFLVQLRKRDIRPGLDPAPALRFSGEGVYLGWDHADRA